MITVVDDRLIRLVAFKLHHFVATEDVEVPVVPQKLLEELILAEELVKGKEIKVGPCFWRFLENPIGFLNQLNCSLTHFWLNGTLRRLND